MLFDGLNSLLSPDLVILIVLLIVWLCIKWVERDYDSSNTIREYQRDRVYGNLKNNEYLKSYVSQYIKKQQKEANRSDGEFKLYHNGKQLWERSVWLDGKKHGEYKEWWEDGLLKEHAFYQYNKDITSEIATEVSDIKNITHKEKVLIKLKYGIDCL